MKDLKFGGAPNQAQQSRNEPEITEVAMLEVLKGDKFSKKSECVWNDQSWSIHVYLLPFTLFCSAAHTFSPELAAKGKDPKLKCITEVARKVWNELDEGPPQTEIERSLKVESCKIEMPHLMSMHNWMWNVGHCRCWGSLKRLLYHLSFLGIWQIIPSNSILSSLSSFPDCPRINHLQQNMPRDHGRRGFHPQWWKQPKLTREASETSSFLKSPKHWWTPPRIWTSAVRRLSKTTWNKYKKLKTIWKRYMKKNKKHMKNAYENRIWAGKPFWGSNQPNQSDESQPKKGDFAAKLLEVVPDPSRQEPAPAVFLQQRSP